MAQAWWRSQPVGWLSREPRRSLGAVTGCSVLTEDGGLGSL
jgi:hypothetical protein